ncbi:AAA family ATPase [Nocardioides sp.]|uniref:AAA family ATPase n=1 Tax=Nocardioides sp. TaxID=35761 RepID=UPI00272CA8E9|nr:AAA family ATPase [Nocardioides sp.]
MLVLTGPPCAGKSAVGHALARTTADPRRVHVEVDALFDLLLPDSDRNPDDRMLAYEAAHDVAVRVLRRGWTVVLECTYSRAEQRTSLLRVLDAVPAAPLWVVEVVVPADVAVDRFRRRTQATDLDEGLVRERVSAYPWSDQALRLDASTARPDDLARTIGDWLSEPATPARPDLWARAGRARDRPR